MAAVLKIDGYDLQPFLRVASDDGLDPFDPDHLEPQFADSASGEGAPLISLLEGNAKQVWPLHLTPLKSASFADTKDGMHALVTDLNLRLKDARELEWRDDGAASSTFRDIVHAQFEPAFDYRKAGKLWVSGILRVWVRPYGHTGTSRVIGTAAGSGLLTTGLATVVGDVSALTRTSLNVIATNPVAHPLLVGVSVVPTAAVPFIMPSSLTVSTIMGASGALASQAGRAFAAGATAVAAAALASAPIGPHRMIALVRAGHATVAGTVAVAAYDTLVNPTTAIGPPVTIPRPSGLSGPWRVADLGAISRSASVVDSLRLTLDIHAGATGGGASWALDIGGVFMLPEDSTALFLDDVFYSVGTYTLDAPARTAARSQGATNSINRVNDISSVQRGALPEVPPSGPRKLVAFALPMGETSVTGAHNAPTAVEIRARERFTFAR